MWSGGQGQSKAEWPCQICGHSEAEHVWSRDADGLETSTGCIKCVCDGYEDA